MLTFLRLYSVVSRFHSLIALDVEMAEEVTMSVRIRLKAEYGNIRV
jgi:hypothetical protein